jgi:hypothetical protein
MTSLYEIAATYRNDAATLADLDLDDQTLADTLEGMAGELEVKAQNVVMFAKNLDATAVAIKEAEQSMSARRKAIEKRADSLRAYVLSSMQLAGVKSIECPYFKLAVQNNPPAVDVFDAKQIPAHLMKRPEPPPAAPDKAAIKALLTEGLDVPGAIIVVGQRLVIK